MQLTRIMQKSLLWYNSCCWQLTVHGQAYYQALVFGMINLRVGDKRDYNHSASISFYRARVDKISRDHKWVFTLDLRLSPDLYLSIHCALFTSCVFAGYHTVNIVTSPNVWSLLIHRPTVDKFTCTALHNCVTFVIGQFLQSWICFLDSS